MLAISSYEISHKVSPAHFPLRFTLTAQSLFQIKRQLDKLGELVVKVTYECDPIPLQKPQMEERVKYLLYHLIKRYCEQKYSIIQHVQVYFFSV